MCASGLAVTLPASSPTLNFTTARAVLFNNGHLPLLLSSVLPAMFLSLSIRIGPNIKVTRAVSRHPLYIPTFCLAVGALFWVAVAACRKASSEGLRELRSSGWLFDVQTPMGSSRAGGWNYWELFDFSQIQWSALSASIDNVLLLLGIGVLVLTVFLRATAELLRVPGIDIDHEIRLHGYANILAALTGACAGAVVCTRHTMPPRFAYFND